MPRYIKGGKIPRLSLYSKKAGCQANSFLYLQQNQLFF